MINYFSRVRLSTLCVYCLLFLLLCWIRFKYSIIKIKLEMLIFNLKVYKADINIGIASCFTLFKI